MDTQRDLFLRLQGIFESSIDAIITINDRGIIEMVNKATSDLFLYSHEEMIDQNIKMLMPEPYKREHDGYLNAYNKTKIPKIIGIGREVTGQRKDGTTFPCRLAVSEVILNDRVIFTGIIHDMTEIVTAREKILDLNKNLSQKVDERTAQLEDAINKLLTNNIELGKEIETREKAEKKLKESQIELQEAFQKEKELGELKSRFVSMASHEFRTPLATILSSASLISKYENADQQEQRLKHVNRIKDSVTNLTGILNDFLSLSKLEEGKIDVNLERFDLNELLVKINNELLGVLKPGQKILFSVSPELNSIRSDQRILKNILFNLISNGIKYSESDIICNFLKEKDLFIITVIDQGMGIPYEDQKYLFDRFFRAGNVINIQGTGLGLNIVKRYIDLLDGDITFVSELNKGTEFKVSLPIISENT